MKKILILIVSITIILIACDLKRTNPLDGIEPPPNISFKDISKLGSGEDVSVRITWYKEDTTIVDGYYLYKSLTYDGKYFRIKVEPNSSSNDSTQYCYDYDVKVDRPHLFYKISAYKYIVSAGDTLEGRLSEPEWVVLK